MRMREKGHPGRPFGVRDMPADVWLWKMETAAACLHHQSLPRADGGDGGLKDLRAEEDHMKDKTEMSSRKVFTSTKRKSLVDFT